MSPVRIGMRYVLPLLASGSAALGVGISTLWFLTPLGLALLLYYLWYVSERWWAAAWAGLLFGFATSGAGIWWFWDTPPLGWLAITSPLVEWYAVGVIWSTVALSMGLAVALGALLLWYIRNNRFVLLATPLVWMVVEEARMLFFSLFTIGENSLVGPHFSVAALGYPLTESGHLLQFASLGGVMALNGVVALGAGALAIYARGRYRVPSIVLGLLLIVPFFLSLPVVNDSPLRVAVIGDTIDASTVRNWDRTYAVLEEVAAQPPFPDVIVLPEGHGITPDTEAAITSLFTNHEVLILNSR